MGWGAISARGIVDNIHLIHCSYRPLILIFQVVSSAANNFRKSSTKDTFKTFDSIAEKKIENDDMMDMDDDLDDDDDDESSSLSEST